jgi:hypothetical protein
LAWCSGENLTKFTSRKHLLWILWATFRKVAINRHNHARRAHASAACCMGTTWQNDTKIFNRWRTNPSLRGKVF